MGKRRGQGEGSIYQRESDGRWCGTISLGYEDGKRQRKVFYGDTRAEVAAQLTAALRAQQQSLPVAFERQTVGAFLQTWLADVIVPLRRGTTAVSYADMTRLHLIPGLGRLQLAKLTPRDVQDFLNRKRAEGLSPRTVQYLRAILRGALTQALKWGLVARNVATLVDVPKVPRIEPGVFTPTEARAFLEVVHGDRLEALYTVALACGLRRGEALGLRWEDVDLEAGTVSVRVAWVIVGSRPRLEELKTERSRRTLALPSFAVAALRTHRARQIEERLHAGPLWHEQSFVFTSPVGAPLGPRNTVRHFKRLLAHAGIPDRRFYDLRHACATLLLVQGVDMRTIMELLGHSSITLTANTYTHVLLELKRDAADRMDALMAQGTPSGEKGTIDDRKHRTKGSAK